MHKRQLQKLVDRLGVAIDSHKGQEAESILRDAQDDIRGLLGENSIKSDGKSGASHVKSDGDKPKS